MDPETYFQLKKTVGELKNQMNQLMKANEDFKNKMMKGLAALIEADKISRAKLNHKNPIQLGKVDEGNFNFPISSIPKGEGVGELKLPESLPVVDPILEVVSSDVPSVPNPVAESSPIPFYDCPIAREETICPTISVQLEEKVEKNISCQNQVAFLIFFYEFEIPKRYLRMFLHLEDFLYDIYEYNISKFLLW